MLISGRGQVSLSLPNPKGYTPAGFITADSSGAILAGKNGGLLVELLDELSNRAGFTWRQSFALFEAPEAFGKTWTELAMWQIRSYDMSGEWWLNSLDRKAMGIGILEGWFDGSLILVTKSLGVQVPSFGEKLVLWSGPLAPEVWGTCVAAAIVVGAAYWLIENKEEGSDLDRDLSSHNAIVSFFGSMLLFTGGGGPAPRTFPGHFLLLAWSLFVLVVINGYAANLVAFLVKKNPPLYTMKDIEDGQARQLKFCVWTSSAFGSITKSLYPGLQIIDANNGNMVTKMVDGECDGVIHGADDWATQSRTKKYNANCTNAKVGDTIFVVDAGWAVSADFGIKCTSLIREVMNIYLTEMKLDGFIDNAKARWRELPSTTDMSACPESGSAAEEDETTPLGIARFEGIFEILAGCIVVSLIWSVVTKTLAGRENAPEHEQDVQISSEQAPKGAVADFGFLPADGEGPFVAARPLSADANTGMQTLDKSQSDFLLSLQSTLEERLQRIEDAIRHAGRPAPRTPSPRSAAVAGRVMSSRLVFDELGDVGEQDGVCAQRTSYGNPEKGANDPSRLPSLSTSDQLPSAPHHPDANRQHWLQ